MALNFGFQWKDLYDHHQLKRVHECFLNFLSKHAPDLYEEVYIQNPSGTSNIIPLAMAVEEFIVQFFGIEQDVQYHYDTHDVFRYTSHFKRNFIQRDALYSCTSANALDGDSVLLQLSQRLGQTIDPRDEIRFAQLGLAALSREDTQTIQLFKQYSAWAYYSDEGKERHRKGYLFKKPACTDPFNRVPVQNLDQHTLTAVSVHSRSSFNLSDAGIDLGKAVDEAFYCIKCHDRGKDTCRTGFKVGEAAVKHDALGQPLSGCPLDQKISEMNVLFEHGQLIAALAVVTLDNPMVAATGHRICYDCSRSCIFQKQDPVDIPSIETRLLKQVLALPYGFEIYSLLTRWNPLNRDTPYPMPNSGYHVLVVGQGPAGFALAHLLMQQGHRVTAIDGLRIAPLPEALKDPARPIHSIADHFEALSERYAKGFGGVAEYGITVRWEKNFLLVIRLLLERRSLYQCLDGVRFGSSITFDSAFNQYGFDHVALCLGAGSPSMLPLAHMTAPGVRLASDFLMALHLGDAAKLHTKTPLRIRLPLGVIGGGLTAVDTATEALAYYSHQVMNFYQRYSAVLKTQGHSAAQQILAEDPDVAEEFIQHGKILCEEMQQANIENRTPDFLPYLNEWGGVTLYYRKKLYESPSYRLNPHELQKALMEGVRFVEEATPLKLHLGSDARLEAVEFKLGTQIRRIPLKTMLIAAGTKPNTVLANEFQELQLDGDFFKPLDNDSFFVVKTRDGRYASYLGDLHPKYSGSVVKALASAKAAAPKIHEALQQRSSSNIPFQPDDFISTVVDLSKVEDTVHLVIRAVAAARTYQAGQFYKLHPYGNEFTEAIPVSPVSVDKHEGTLSFIINVVGASTRQLQELRINDRVFLMGPAGSKLSIPKDHKLLLLVDPHSPEGIADPILQNLSNTTHHLVANIDQISQDDFRGFESIFVLGSDSYIQQFSTIYKDISVPVYTYVHAHLQCMMKQVCAQCIYLHKDPNTGSTSIQFGCAKSIENLKNFSYADLNKRNKNERMEETLFAHWAAGINPRS